MITDKKSTLLDKAYTTFIELMVNSDEPIDLLDNFAIEDVMGFGTTLDEKILDRSGLKALAKLQREQSADVKIEYILTPVFRKMLNQECTAIIVDELKLIMHTSNETLELDIRLSTVLEYLDGNWKVVHWHGSKPEYDARGLDTWHKEEWKQKNEALQKLVDEKTADLIIKNRELEIESSLERVRAVAMSMQKPSDLLDVCQIISEQLESLYLTDIRNIQVAIINESKKNYLNYQYFAAYSKRVFEETEYDNNPTAHAMVSEMQRSANSFFTGSMKGKTLKEFITWRNTYNQFPDPLLDNSSGVFYYFYSIGQGGLGLTTYKEINGSDLEIFKRFHKVFTLAYQRFKDIELALEQAKEAQIEAALEKVRSRSLAMHKSEELADLSLELVKQIQALDVATWFCAFNIYDDDPKGSLEWGSNGQGTFPKYRTPREGIFLRYYEAGQRGETLLINEIDEKECPGHYEYLCSLPGVGKQLLKMQEAGIPFPASQIDHVAYFKYGYILFITFEPASEAYDIFKRFAKVFEQTYTRFLDLQKAETQAREAQIEAAMERVRAQSMMMRHSTELNITSRVFHEQLNMLGINPEFSYLWLPNEDKAEHLFWATWQEEQQGLSTYYNRQVVYPLDKSEPAIEACFVAWESGNPVHVNPVQADGVADYFKEWPELLEGVDKFKPENYPEGLYYVDAYMKYGCFGIMIRKLLSEDEQHILHRFSREFERAYTRFLDLQKVEAQAREAQIEVALEKVRSRSLAMHTANELGDVVAVIVEKLKDLDVVLDANGVVLCTYFHDSKDVLHWIASSDFTFAGSYLLPYFDHPIYNDTWQSKESGAEYFSKAYSVELKNSFFKYAFEHSDYKHFSEDFKQWVFQNDQHILSFAWQKNSAILIPSHTGVVPSEDDVATLKRFAKVFEQTYTRFLDLQKAEAQAREAQVELALERIRAQVTAMSESEDLLDIVVMMQAEFTRLGHEAHYFWHMRWLPDKYEKALTNGDGTRIGNVMELPRGFHGIQKMLDWEKTNEPSAVFALDTDTAADYIDKMINLGRFQEIDHSAPGPDEVREMGGLTFVMARTTHGEIGYTLPGEVPNPPEKDIATLIRFAGVFDLAYRRFEDLKSAEKRNREAQIELALERVRARALAMQQPEELKDVAQVMRHEMGFLGIEELETSSIYINDEIAQNAECWYAIKDVRDEEKTMVNDYFALNLNDTHVGRKMLKFYNSDKEKVSIVMTGKSRVEWIRYCEKKSVPLRGYYGEDIPDRTYHLYKFSHGAIGAATPGDFSPENWGLLKRAASVFSLAYSRFKDLTQARYDLQLLKEEKKRAEDALSELKSTQTQLIHSEKMASLGELTAGIAHEIQNPLNFVNNFSEVSADLIDEMNEEMESGDMREVKAITDDLKQNLEKISHHGKRASSIVKGMLEHSRAGDGHKDLTDINAIADEYLRLAYHGLRAKDKSFNADFKVDMNEALPKVKVVPQDIGRVLLNLINNAFYAVSSKALAMQNGDYKPTVIVSTRKIKDNIEIKVMDNGDGISSEVMEKIFQPFFTTKPSGEGTGLGLSLSYDIITKGHNGELKVQSKEGEGTEFIIELPIK